jgi:hypothetical protein
MSAAWLAPDKKSFHESMGTVPCQTKSRPFMDNCARQADRHSVLHFFSADPAMQIVIANRTQNPYGWLETEVRVLLVATTSGLIARLGKAERHRSSRVRDDVSGSTSVFEQYFVGVFRRP